MARKKAAPDFEHSLAELQALVYEQVPAIKVGDAYSYDLMSPKLQGVGQQIFWPTFWNVSFE